MITSVLEEQITPEIEGIYERHVASGRGHVIMVALQFREGFEDIAIFSTLKRARAWVEAYEANPDVMAAAFFPYVIDNPDFNEIPAKGQLN